MNFDHRPENLIRGEEFMICATCGAPVGRDRDVEWEHLDEPGRADLLSRGLPKHRSWQSEGEVIHRSLETLATLALTAGTRGEDDFVVTPDEHWRMMIADDNGEWDKTLRGLLAMLPYGPTTGQRERPLNVIVRLPLIRGNLSTGEVDEVEIDVKPVRPEDYAPSSEYGPTLVERIERGEVPGYGGGMT